MKMFFIMLLLFPNIALSQELTGTIFFRGTIQQAPCIVETNDKDGHLNTTCWINGHNIDEKIQPLNNEIMARNNIISVSARSIKKIKYGKVIVIHYL